jgi:methylmalonyl-CoA mutase cobalamin-binding subunit
MTTSLESLLPHDLPSSQSLIEKGRDIGRTITCGVSMLCREYGVRNEIEYKRKMQAEGRLMTVMDIGMQDWPETARALERIHAELDRRGIRVDRYNLILDRRMGIPKDQWETAPKETGPMLRTPDEWLATTNTVPIQPHVGDYMIGSPMSVHNTRAALEAGITYIGNVSQFAWKYPGWDDEVAQMVEMVTAIGIMSSKRGEAMCHTYLDDGYPAQFRDYCSYVGWALFERYIVETLIGANLSIAYGGLSTHPITRAAMIVALERIRPRDSIAAYYHCTTTAYTAEIDRNYGILGVDCLYTFLAQMRAGTAAVVQPTPVFEAVRVPRWEEIVTAQTIAHRVADDARRVYDFIDWDPIERLADRMIEGGKVVFDQILDGLDSAGVDTKDPLQLLLAVRRLGAIEIENRWGVGQVDPNTVGGYRAVLPTDTLSDFIRARDQMLASLGDVSRSSKSPLRCIVGSTDVHEFGMLLVVEAMRAIGIEPIVAGTSIDPDEFADLALETSASAIVISTHNGMALTYAKQLKAELEERNLNLPVFFGGTLNQDFEGHDAPVDVYDELVECGVRACREIGQMVDGLRALA